MSHMPCFLFHLLIFGKLIIYLFEKIYFILLLSILRITSCISSDAICLLLA